MVLSSLALVFAAVTVASAGAVTGPQRIILVGLVTLPAGIDVGFKMSLDDVGGQVDL